MTAASNFADNSCFSILIGSSGGSSSIPPSMPCPICGFSILIGSSGGSRTMASRLCLRPSCFSILIGSSGGSRLLAEIAKSASLRFSILIGSSGGSSQLVARIVAVQIMFQYPHRIVGGFKLSSCFAWPGMIIVSVSSSDRRGVQGCSPRWVRLSDQVSVSSSDRRGVQGRKFVRRRRFRSSFSILIGSSGGSRTCR